MNQKDLIRKFIMIANWIKPLVSMAYTQIFQGVKGYKAIWNQVVYYYIISYPYVWD